MVENCEFKIEIELLFLIQPDFQMEDLLSERLLNELMDGCQKICENIGCMPHLIR